MVACHVVSIKFGRNSDGLSLPAETSLVAAVPYVRSCRRSMATGQLITSKFGFFNLFDGIRHNDDSDYYEKVSY
jgi:hypothetical protein